MSINLWMDRQMWSIHTREYSLAIKRNKVLIDSFYHVDKPWKRDVKWKKSDTNAMCYVILLHEMSRMGKSTEIENRLVVSRGWEVYGEMGSDC